MNIKNHVQLVGRLGAEPKVKMLDNGTWLARFSIAVSSQSANKTGEKINKVQWHTVTAFGPLAEICQKLLHKGTQATISGKLSVRVYINKEGARRTKTEVMANELFVPQTELSLTEVA